MSVQWDLYAQESEDVGGELTTRIVTSVVRVSHAERAREIVIAIMNVRAPSYAVLKIASMAKRASTVAQPSKFKNFVIIK